MQTRHFGIDIHKEFVVVAAVNDHQQIIQPPQRVEMSEITRWAAQTLTHHDRVVIEVTTNAWHVHDVLAAYAGQVLVANPYKTKLIAEAHVKSDKIDALVLARLLASRFIYEVFVPDQVLRQHRQLVAHRTALSKQLRRIKGQLHALLNRRNVRCPVESIFSSEGRTWLENFDWTPIELLILKQQLAQLDLCQQQIEETEHQIARLTAEDERIPRLMQISGINYFTAFALVSTIGDVYRFASPRKLCAYLGLVPSLHQSGNHGYNGHITKTGNTDLRWLIVEAAWNAVRWDPHWKQVYERIKQRRGSSIAIVAVARKLVVVMWHLLHDRTIYHHLQPKAFIQKLQGWAWQIGRQHLTEATSIDFVRNRLKSLGLHDLVVLLTTNKKGKLQLRPA